MLTSCNFNTTSYSNVDAVNTVVDLSNADYEILKTVEGFSKQTYVFGIGGLSQKSLVENAKADMYKNADLKNNEAIIYPSTTTSVSNYLGIVSIVRAHAFGYKIKINKSQSSEPKKEMTKDIVNKNTKKEDIIKEKTINKKTVKEDIINKNIVDTKVLTFNINESGKFNIILLKTNNTTNDDFYIGIGQTEVTKYLWNTIMELNSSEMSSDDNKVAINNISINEIEIFCEKLNKYFESELPNGYIFTIPTSLEWELAAKGGKMSNTNIYSGGNNINKVAWYGVNTANKYYIATKEPNELNIYDMSGGVSEICKNEDSGYVTRGGSYLDGKNSCKITSVQPFKSQNKSKKAGLRLVLKKQNN